MRMGGGGFSFNKCGSASAALRDFQGRRPGSVIVVNSMRHKFGWYGRAKFGRMVRNLDITFAGSGRGPGP